MKATLTYSINGLYHTMDFESAVDAIDFGVQQLANNTAVPINVMFNGRPVAIKEDFILEWEVLKRSPPEE